jgi:hypothetical protein
MEYSLDKNMGLRNGHFMNILIFLKNESIRLNTKNFAGGGEEGSGSSIDK